MTALGWSHRTSEVREAKSFSQAAADAQRAAMSERIGNAQCLELTADYSIAPLEDGAFRAEGRIHARLEQTCGVTLEPIEQVIDEPFEVLFAPGAAHEADLDAAFDPLGDDPPEAIVNGRLDVGRVVAEIVASAADPFPRAPDAVLDVSRSGGQDADETGDNPFAVLGKLGAGEGREGD